MTTKARIALAVVAVALLAAGAVFYLRPTPIDPTSVDTMDEYVELVNTAYGDAGLGLHRGHQDIEPTLIDYLGIGHDEMHVRMEEQGQNLEAVAVDLGLDPTGLVATLVEEQSPALDNLLDNGTISADEADAYRQALEDAYTYRVSWNGSDPTPEFDGI